MVRIINFYEQHNQSRVFLQRRKPDISSPVCIPYSNCILPCLYIGDLRLALNVLQRDDHMSITHMISLVSSSILSTHCRPCVSNPFFCSPENRYELSIEIAKHGSSLVRMVIPLEDAPEQNILDVLRSCFDFIEEGRKHGAVLVHCMGGSSRSAAIIVAYVMKTLKMTVEEALALVNKDYKKAMPNPGFMKQLYALEKNLCKDRNSEKQ